MNDTDTLTVKLGLKLSQLIDVVSLIWYDWHGLHSTLLKFQKNNSCNFTIFLGLEESGDDNQRVGRASKFDFLR